MLSLNYRSCGNIIRYLTRKSSVDSAFGTFIVKLSDAVMDKYRKVILKMI